MSLEGTSLVSRPREAALGLGVWAMEVEHVLLGGTWWDSGDARATAVPSAKSPSCLCVACSTRLRKTSVGVMSSKVTLFLSLPQEVA
jgi:hypothetical protein